MADEANPDASDEARVGKHHAGGENADSPMSVGGQDGDALPEDLDVTAYVGPYTFPDTVRRRMIAATLFVVAAACAAGWAVTGNGAMIGAAVLLGAAGGYHLLAGWRRRVDDGEALLVATRTVGFPVGHASAQLVFRGLRSRPTWRILLYSADEPPTKRGLVQLDAVDGTVLGEYVEDNPEDWSDLAR